MSSLWLHHSFSWAVGVAYISYIGLILAKYVPARVQHDDEGFEVELGENKKLYSWNDISRVKNYKKSQILRLFDCNGKTIYVVDHKTPGYPEFAAKINESYRYLTSRSS